MSNTNPTETIEFTVSLSLEADAKLAKLAALNRTTPSEILRRLLLLADALVESKVAGDRLVLLDEHDNIKSEIVGLI